MSLLSKINAAVAGPAAWLASKAGVALDKATHAVIGALAALSVGILMKVVGLGSWALLAGFLVSVVLGVSKEVHDSRAPGGVVDRWDAIWTMIGGAAACAFLALA